MSPLKRQADWEKGPSPCKCHGVNSQQKMIRTEGGALSSWGDTTWIQGAVDPMLLVELLRRWTSPGGASAVCGPPSSVSPCSSRPPGVPTDKCLFTLRLSKIFVHSQASRFHW
jgi:hypothetical protein